MKKMFYILAVFSVYAFCLYSEEMGSSKLYRNGRGRALLPPYFSVYQSFEGMTFLKDDGSSVTGFTSPTYIELTLGKKVFFDGNFGMSLLPIGNIYGYSCGIGVGFNMLDNRDDDYLTGDTLRMSFMYSGKFLISMKENTVYDSFTMLSGGNISLTYQRHFYNNFALRLGMIFGAYAADSAKYSVALNYGLSIGLAF